MAFMKAALGLRAVVFLAAGFLAAAFLAAIGFFPPWGTTSPLEIFRTLTEADRARKGLSPLKRAFSPSDGTRQTAKIQPLAREILKTHAPSRRSRMVAF